MHAGSIDNPKSAAGRVYAILRFCQGRWLSGWYLTTEARVTAVGTRVSEVRHQLPAGRRIEHKTSHEGVSGSWYRLVVEMSEADARRDFPPSTFDNHVPRCIIVPRAVDIEAVGSGREDRTGRMGTVAPQMKLDIQGT